MRSAASYGTCIGRPSGSDGVAIAAVLHVGNDADRYPSSRSVAARAEARIALLIGNQVYTPKVGLLMWLISKVEKFPRAQKFLLGDRIQTTARRPDLPRRHGWRSE
jgi:hypothetical protein